ncbi:hypothetical protein Hanom_Chr02g00124711 [Helianthus anomalus]
MIIKTAAVGRLTTAVEPPELTVAVVMFILGCSSFGLQNNTGGGWGLGSVRVWCDSIQSRSTQLNSVKLSQLGQHSKPQLKRVNGQSRSSRSFLGSTRLDPVN